MQCTMPTGYRDSDEDDDFGEPDLDERENPDNDDADWNENPDVVPCPHCGQEVSEIAEWCPNCDQYISNANLAPGRRPLWIILGLLLTAAVLVTWICMR